MNLSGPLVSFYQDDWAHHKRDMAPPFGFGIEIEVDHSSLEEYLQIPVLSEKEDKMSLKYRFEYSEKQKYYAQELAGGNSVLFRSEQHSKNKGIGRYSIHYKMEFPTLSMGDDLPFGRLHGFLDADSFEKNFLGTEEYKKNKEFSSHINLCVYLIDYMRQFLYDNIFYLTTQRGNLSPDLFDQSHKREQDERAASVGTKGENTIKALSILSGPSGDSMAMLKVKQWAEKFGLPGLIAGVIAHSSEGSGVDVSYEDPDFGVRLNLPMAGFGSQQMLPVIGQLFCAPPGSVVMIEEPEISLHPHGQIILPDLFIDAMNNNRQVIVTTHSQIIVSAIRHAVKRKKLKPEQVALYDMVKTASGAGRKRLQIDEDGTIPGWIPSFAEAEDKMFDAWGEEEE